MNHYINSQIMNMSLMAKTFIASCEMAARKDDGQIDKAEEKTLKKLRKATEQFIKEIESVK